MVRINQIETALKAGDIVRNSFQVDKKQARWVAPARMEVTKSGYCVYTITKKPRERSRTHKVLCQMEPGYTGLFENCPSVKVDCDCARFLYVWNYALLEHDAAIRDRTNTEPPVVTNPREVPGICKHGIIALQALRKANPRWTPPANAVTASTKSNAISLTDLHLTLKRIRDGR